MSADDIQSLAEEKMKKAIASVQYEMGSIRTGRANPLILDRVTVDYYGTPTPVRQMANVTVQEGQTLVIQPYDKSSMGDIEKAISKSDINLPVNNDGTVLRLNVPPLTEERRKEMVKTVKKIGEEGKVAIRNIRRDATSDVEKLKKAENLSEDEVKLRQDKIQKLTDKYIGQLEQMVSDKEKEVMEV
ncbi:MAG: ribosome recycling factor [Vampirovibrio sp.]|jgi:ribosome recycling factor|nr:ribosome recycling factor [Vampirovibrio sp.]